MAVRWHTIDPVGIPSRVAIFTIAALTPASGILVLVRVYETQPRDDRTPVPADADLESWTR